MASQKAHNWGFIWRTHPGPTWHRTEIQVHTLGRMKMRSFFFSLLKRASKLCLTWPAPDFPLSRTDQSTTQVNKQEVDDITAISTCAVIAGFQYSHRSGISVMMSSDWPCEVLVYSLYCCYFMVSLMIYHLQVFQRTKLNWVVLPKFT